MDKHVRQVGENMKIFTSKTTKLSANQQVNRVGKYLFNHIDSAYNYKKSGNMFDVYITAYYQDTSRLDSSVEEMNIDINITTYSNKLRINIISLDENEKTIGSDVYTPEFLEDLPKAYSKIMHRIKYRMSKEFSKYEFIF